MSEPVIEDQTREVWDAMLADDGGQGDRQPGDPLGGDK